MRAVGKIDSRESANYKAKPLKNIEQTKAYNNRMNKRKKNKMRKTSRKQNR